jgi:hypothetical protein
MSDYIQFLPWARLHILSSYHCWIKCIQFVRVGNVFLSDKYMKIYSRVAFDASRNTSNSSYRQLIFSDFNGKSEFVKKKLSIFPNIYFYENPFSCYRVVACRQTERHDESSR